MSEHPMPDLEALAADQADANGVVSVEIRASLLIYRLSAALISEAREAGRLREALRPFASYHGSDAFLASDAPDYAMCSAVSFTAGNYRAARQALSPPTPDAGE